MSITPVALLLIGVAMLWWLGGIGAADERERRRAYLARPHFEPIARIDDPIVAAATLLRFVAGDRGWPRARDIAVTLLSAVSPERCSREDAIARAEWTAGQLREECRAIGALCVLAEDWLDEGERADLRHMVDAVAEAASTDDPRARRRAATAIRALDAGRAPGTAT